MLPHCRADDPLPHCCSRWLSSALVSDADPLLRQPVRSVEGVLDSVPLKTGPVLKQPVRSVRRCTGHTAPENRPTVKATG